jgi:hypothetical protein
MLIRTASQTDLPTSILTKNLGKPTDRLVQGAGYEGVVHRREGEGDHFGRVAGEVA